MSASTLAPVRRALGRASPPRLVPERGQVLRNVIRAVFSCLCCKGARQRVGVSRRSATVAPV
ncbi:hypothetical protein CTI12_AA556710 [Artemisia annua]|uniref:Uncharacterized protein n=1 Tax=Artemisia annua TaxID=35608 RepID=A0A2U1KX64_ARTAN|nr:hypothetical protein CTI12_AA556710 [Artemisia annua]